MESKREYKYEIVLRNDDEKYQEQLQNIITSFNTIYCVHDKDIYDDDLIIDDQLLHKAGDQKYKHTHFIIKLKYAKTISSVAKIVGCKETDVQRIKNFNSALKYLIHYKDDSKFNYDYREVKYNNEELYKRFRELIFNDLEEDDKVLPLIDYIVTSKHPIYFEQFIYYVQSTRQWSVYRRNASTFIKLLDDHNSHLRKYGL